MIKPKAAAARAIIRITSAALALAILGCDHGAPIAPRPGYARAERVEMDFRGQSFVLGDNDTVAMLTPVSGPRQPPLELPFWLGVNVLVPGVLQPKEGDYYVISEAVLVKPLKSNEWLIEAGSSLIKKETVLITTRTRFLNRGKLLPMIVQYAGLRQFTRSDGTAAAIPVLKEVSLPMKWTLSGRIPNDYARFEVR